MTPSTLSNQPVDLFVCRTRAFLLPRNPTMTPAKALEVLAKLEGESQASDAYV